MKKLVAAGGTSRTLISALVAAVFALVASTCSQSPTQPSPGGGGTPNVPNNPNNPLPTPNVSAIFSGAGDIADCPTNAAESTAGLLDRIGGDIFTLGDNAYPNGSAENFGCYDRSWGRHRGRTHPAIGNHEYKTPGARGYFDYFGSAAGDYGLGYYSFDLGAWHIVSLNSNYRADEGNINVSASSPQAAWLRADLAAYKPKCTLAYWHHPLYSSGQNGDNLAMRDMFRILYDAGVDLLLTGHDHLYERFAPQDVDGRPDPQRGIRQFIVGSGGVTPLYPFTSIKPNSEVRIAVHGVLKLTLNPENYQFEFMTTAGTRDAGTGTCH